MSDKWHEASRVGAKHMRYVGSRSELKDKSALVHRLPETVSALVMAQFDDVTIRESCGWWPFPDTDFVSIDVVPTRDQEFLNWVADRFVFVYGERAGTDFVLRLRQLAKEAGEMPPTGTLTVDDVDRMTLDAARWRSLMELIGHYMDGSDEVVKLFWDDATRAAIIKVGDRSWYGSSFEDVIGTIIEERDA